MHRISFALDESDVALFIGVVLPPDPNKPGTIVLASTVNQKAFEPEDREPLMRFSRFNTWPAAVTIMEGIGGNESDLEDWITAGLIRRLPGLVNSEEFRSLFSDLALITLTAAAVATITEQDVSLAVPNDDGVLPVSRLLYEVILRSGGDRPLPVVLDEVCQGDQKVFDLLVGEIIVSFRFMLNSRVAAVIYAQ